VDLSPRIRVNPRLHIIDIYTLIDGRTDFPKAFMDRVKEIGDHWIWQNKPRGGGYGQMFLCRGPGGVVLAHRLSYVLFVGLIPNGLDVLHSCDIPMCVKPDHLFIGTPKDNTQDMIHKGRGAFPGPNNPATGDRNAMRKYPEKRPCGEKNGFAKYTWTQVRKARMLFQTGMSRHEVSSQVGIPYGTLKDILLGTCWKE
jgi:hypothetical protein